MVKMMCLCFKDSKALHLMELFHKKKYNSKAEKTL